MAQAGMTCVWRTLHVREVLGALACFAASFLLLVACGVGGSLECDTDDPATAKCVVSNASLWTGFQEREFRFRDLTAVDFQYQEFRTGNKVYTSENQFFVFRDGSSFALYPRDADGVVSTIDDGQLRRAIAGKARIDEGFAVAFGIAAPLISAMLGFFAFVFLLFWGPEWVTLDWQRREVRIRRLGVIDAGSSTVRLDEVAQIVSDGGYFALTTSGRGILLTRYGAVGKELAAVLQQARFPVVEWPQEQTNRFRDLVGNLVRLALVGAVMGMAWIAMVVALSLVLTL